MVKCDVCGKKSLLPEKFSTINMCKVCFMKVNGVLWKHQYERSEDAEKQRCKALETAHKHNFPQPVIAAINDYFVSQMNTMVSCDCCRQPVQHLQQLGNAHICKQCFGKINNSAWKETVYEDNDGVENNRQKILKIANKNGFPPNVIEGINIHFDSKIQKGLVCTLNGGKSQKLKVYDTYCILITDDNFDVEETSKEYGAVLKKSQPKENLFSNGVAKDLARTVLSGGVVRAGINLAKSAAINVAADKIAPEKGMFKVVNGEFLIDYAIYSYSEYRKCNDNEIGYIRFINSHASERQSEDMIFFFDSDNRKIDDAYNAIVNGISSSKKAITAQVETPSIVQNPVQLSSVADEILKFKNLLDIGAITSEEFEAKKKELLKL